jgi:hypothetical protein
MSFDYSMKNRIRFYLIVTCGIVLFDAIASFASRAFAFNYSKLFWLSWCLWALAGFFGCKYFDFLSGIGAGLVAGLSDSTVGWALSSAIGPNIPFTPYRPTPMIILLVVMSVSFMSTVIGFIGALVGNVVK